MDDLVKVITEPRKTGAESIIDNQGTAVSSMQRYWQWTYSSLLGNTERGNFAEYLVACALGLDNGTRTDWDSYDLKTTDGITIEVKASGYIQTWNQKQLSSPSFSIRPTHAWNPATNTYEAEAHRQAMVYVFCLFNHKHKDDELNPLDMAQWEFYVMPTAKLNHYSLEQKSISLKMIKNLGAIPCVFSELQATIHIAVKES